MATPYAPSGIADKPVFIPAADTTDRVPTGTGAPVLASAPQRNPSALHQPADNAGQQNPPPSSTQPVLASTGTGRESESEDGDNARSDQDVEKNIGSADHADIATSYNDPGLLLQAQGRHDQALEYYCKALAIQEKVLGTDHTDTVASYSNIALLLKAQGKPAQALEYYRKALANAVAHNHPDAAKYRRRIDSLSKKLRVPEQCAFPAGRRSRLAVAWMLG
jgi:tetratricopeptide (TPR) repeat protein